MKQASLILRGAALAAALCAASVPAMAQQSQWNKGDNSTKQRTAILKKEINAAYAEQQTTCKRQSAGKRSACMKSARQTYQQDMANVPRLVANAPQSEVIERVVSVTPVSPAPAAAAPGSTAYGSSSAGSTTSSGSGNASSDAASGTAPASTGAAPGTPQSSVTGEGGQSGAMMPEPAKPMVPSQPQPRQMPDAPPAQQQQQQQQQ